MLKSSEVIEERRITFNVHLPRPANSSQLVFTGYESSGEMKAGEYLNRPNLPFTLMPNGRENFISYPRAGAGRSCLT